VARSHVAYYMGAPVYNTTQTESGSGELRLNIRMTSTRINTSSLIKSRKLLA